MMKNKDQRLAWLKAQSKDLPDFVWIPDFISITGSTMFANREPQDMDIVIKAENVDSLLSVKLTRVAKETYQAKPHLILEPAGPNWPYLPIYDLVLKKKSVLEIHEIEEPEFAERLYHQRAASEKTMADAQKSKEEDSIELFRFYLPMKPTRITLPQERQTVDRFVSYFSDDDFPVLNSKKYDGVHIIIFREKNKVEIWSEDGREITRYLPSIIKEFLTIKKANFIIEAELEQWAQDHHQPRESVAARIHLKSPQPDDDLIANVFTCLFIDGEDLHKKTEMERQEALKSLGIEYSVNEIPDLKHKLNLVPNILCDNLKQLQLSTQKLRYLPASEGVVAKKADSLYFLDGDSREGWIKFHNSAVLKAKVIEALETKTQGVFNYRYGILPGSYQFRQADLQENLVEVGKTFSTSTKCHRGDAIEIEFETFNITHDERKDIFTISAWAPAFLGKASGEPDSVDDVVKKAEDAKVLQEKVITLEGETVYL